MKYAFSLHELDEKIDTHQSHVCALNMKLDLFLGWVQWLSGVL